MKKRALLILLPVLTMTGMAQVGINTDGSSPDASAMLDVKSTSKGVLVPRMTAAQRDAISSPATGLLIFCTTDNQYYSNSGIPSSPAWVLVSSQWINNGSNIYFAAGNVGIGTATPALKLDVNGRIGATFGTESSPSYVFSSGTENTGFSSPDPYELAISNNGSESARFGSDGRMGLGTSSPNSHSILDIASQTKGMLIPRMTNAQISTFGETLGAADKGMIVFNADDIKLEYWDGTAWKTMVTKTSAPGSSSDGTGFCPTEITDYNGNHYSTVRIGEQCWMAENLKSTHYANGSAISGHCAYGNDEGNALTYGRLYTWAAVMNGASSSNTNPSGVQGVCPDGWHVPSDAEWKEMEMTIGMTTVEANESGYRGTHSEGRKLKETDDAFLWGDSDNPGTNNSGFTALPGGISYYPGHSINLSTYAFIWTSTESSNPTHSYYRVIKYDQSGVGRWTDWKIYSCSVRCVMN